MQLSRTTTVWSCCGPFTKAERRYCSCRRGQLGYRERVLAVQAELSSEVSKQKSPRPTSADTSKNPSCPFLTSLATPPVAHVPWYKRPGQLFAPQAFQQLVLGSATTTIVQVPKQLWFSGLYVPAESELVKDVLSAELSGSIKQDIITALPLDKLMGQHSLILQQEPSHRKLRGLLAPAFSAGATAEYLPAIQKLVGGHLSAWATAGETGVKGYDAIKHMTFEFIISLTLGKDYNPQDIHHLDQLFHTWGQGFLAWPWLDLPFTPFAKALQARRSLLEHFQRVVNAARTKLEAGGEVGGIVAALVAAEDEVGNRLTDAEITDNILLLLHAGHETSSIALSRILSDLTDHPKVMQQLRAEQAVVVEQHGEAITAAALKSMVYADAVIRESLRLNPVVSWLTRVSTQDMELDGYHVPQDTTILLPLHHLAVNDKRWVGQADSKDVCPQRLLTDEGVKPGALLPFGHGPRFCLGAGLAIAEVKVFLALVARNYSFTADNNTEWKQGVGRFPANGLPVVFKALKSTT